MAKLIETSDVVETRFQIPVRVIGVRFLRHRDCVNVTNWTHSSSVLIVIWL